MDTLNKWGERGLHTGLSTLSGFQKFILRGNVVDLAIGVVIGAAFNTVVQGFVKDFITPLIGWFINALGGMGVDPQHFAQAQAGGFLYGDFITVFISFLITAFVVYFFVVKPVAAFQDRMEHLHPKKDAATTTRDCPFCLSTVNIKATRCAYCTSQLPPTDQPAPTGAS